MKGYECSLKLLLPKKKNRKAGHKLNVHPPKTMVTMVMMRATRAVKPPVISFLVILVSSSRQYPMKNRRKIPVILEIFRAFITGENIRKGIITIMEEPTTRPKAMSTVTISS
jgi:hypothetical protein